MIQLHQVSKSFVVGGKRVPIVQIGSWTVETGERVALTGPSGCGKSTLLHLLGGVLTADTGELQIGAYALQRMSEAQRDRYRAQQVGYIFQDFHLLSSLTARQNVELALPRAWTKQQRREQLDEWFARVGLADRQHHRPGQLSRGQQQRVAIARALIGKPPLVLADEPTGSLDWETAGTVMQLLLELCAAERMTLVTVTHDLHLARLFPVQAHMGELNELLKQPGAGPWGTESEVQVG
ncbi:ABC transporter ATP-binding protein [Paenibacillus athensensis]|uniref:ABC transporter ATP-binding protein n=1 Tax=Paenibacillus athensensis TaxID=1967502 RepID=A0A4Y8PUK4_9BACL|nr:ABC transporter ATP-binding protein [Paenibacillus athensensis]MCD1261722.1 ABC transporter ATP-binding protein [Paenibacillus athensensis]